MRVLRLTLEFIFFRLHQGKRFKMIDARVETYILSLWCVFLFNNERYSNSKTLLLRALQVC
jgi:hypothetical protein